MSVPTPGRKPRKRLAASEKYEVFVQVLTQQATQREIAEKWGVDRATVVSICKTAKQAALPWPGWRRRGRVGRAGRSSRPSWRRLGRRSSG